MSTMNDGTLRAAAERGNIGDLYSIIQVDPSVLENIDSKPFVETPLHTAASRRQLRFATEVAMLKPSFARKLNQEGFSPIHLAVQNNDERMVLRFVDINKDLARVKGREGLTPLHLASKNGNADLLAKFLLACPESIEDVTVQGETALHIAVKYEQYEALQVLVGWLKTNTQRGARKLEHKILNWKDEAGNTILHVSAQNNQSQALRVLLKTRIILKAKNLEDLTALDIAGNEEIKSILVSAGAKPGSEVTNPFTLSHILRSKISIWGTFIIFILRIRMNMSNEQRNTSLVVATLVVTATYQAALTPPGGVYQISAGDSNVNTTSHNSTATAIPRNVGKSILSTWGFIYFWMINILSFVVSAITIFILTPVGSASVFVWAPVICFVYCYHTNMVIISPITTARWISYVTSYILTYSMCAISMIITKHNRYRNAEIEAGAVRENIWWF